MLGREMLEEENPPVAILCCDGAVLKLRLEKLVDRAVALGWTNKSFMGSPC